MDNCTICPFVKYWYIVLAVVIVGWAVYRFMQARNAPPPREIAGVESLTSQTFEGHVAAGVTLVDFWAPWCGPCRMQMPIIEETVGGLPAGVKIAKVNVDEAGDLARRFGINGVPTWVVFRDGREVYRTSGVQDRAELLEMAKRE